MLPSHHTLKKMKVKETNLSKKPTEIEKGKLPNGKHNKNFRINGSHEKAKLENDQDDQETPIVSGSVRMPPKKKGYNYVSKKQLLVTQETIPWWASRPHIMDKQLRTQDDPEYDPSTLFIPEDERRKLSPNLRQFWEFKSRNYDKLILFKMGGHYELFYDDAILATKVLDLSWDHRRLSVAFHEQQLEENAGRLLEVCSKIAIVEQTESIDDMRARVRGIPYNPNLYVVHRAVGQVLTKGTWNINYKDYDSRYLLILNKKEKNIAFCLFEASVLEVNYGILDIDPEMNQLRTLLWQTNPVEIIYNIECLEYKKIFTNLPKKPDLSLLNQNWNDFDEFPFIPKYIKDGLVLNTIKGLFFYLKQSITLETVQAHLIFKQYLLFYQNKKIMGLDYQGLAHLEIFYTNNYTKLSRRGSLYEFLDKTSSPFGHRLLGKWLSAPLNDIKQIYDRIEAIEDLRDLSEVRDSFQKKLKSIPDIERIFVCILKFLKKAHLTKLDDIPACKLKNLKDLLYSLRIGESLVVDFQEKADIMKSDYLRRLINYEEKGGLLPHSNKIIEESMEWIDWNGDKPIPKYGYCKEYDEVRTKIKKVEDQMEIIINKFRKQFSDPTIKYYHSKIPYQIEINEIFVRGIKKPANLEFVSCGPYVERFHTAEIKENLIVLEGLEREQSRYLFVFLKQIYSYFMENSFLWQQLIHTLAELDCLCSLSKISFDPDFTYPMTKPKFRISETPFLKIDQGIHPCLLKFGVKFQPITVNFNSKLLSSPEMILLTGPNMGGKSTTLRTIGVIAILAHLGCYVPAQECELTLVENIFTRMGSEEILYEKKSSFFIELEETKNILLNANEKSLILIDELGKGTSTYDGVAIAYSVLKYIVEEIKCRGIFTTHYHSLSKEFSLYERLNLFHMGFYIEAETNHVIFEYQIKEGDADRSHGILLAKRIFERAGIGQEIIQKAIKVCDDFEHCNEKFDSILNSF